MVWFKDGLRFSCLQCGRCCRGSGYVWCTLKEAEKIADFLGVKDFDLFKANYLIKKEKAFILKDNLKGDCIFYDYKGRCTIYPVRPLQCKTFPFWPEILSSHKNWHLQSKECPGINYGKLHTFKEIISILNLMLEYDAKS